MRFRTQPFCGRLCSIFSTRAAPSALSARDLRPQSTAFVRAFACSLLKLNIKGVLKRKFRRASSSLLVSLCGSVEAAGEKDIGEKMGYYIYRVMLTELFFVG